VVHEAVSIAEHLYWGAVNVLGPMKDKDKTKDKNCTKEQLINELSEMHQRVDELGGYEFQQ
jgi:hypothetical protein